MVDKNRVLITGANGGIGNSIAEKMLRSNAELILFYNQKQDQIEKLIEKFPDSFIQRQQVNLMDSQSIEKSLKKILEKGPIEIFVHCVTIPITNSEVLNLDWNSYQSHIDIQARAFFQIIKNIVPEMKKLKKGKIVSILSSYTTERPPSKISHYLVGKYALLGLCKSLAVELGPYGINVNCISPTMTETPLIKDLPSKFKELTAKQIPLRRIAIPKDIAPLVDFLCSSDSNYITGENFLITGGEVMR